MMTIEYLRSFRIGEYAVFDLTIAFLGIFLVSPILSKLFLYLHLDIPKKNWLFLTLPLSILIHLLVGQNTKMVQNFFMISDHYLLKLLIIGLVILGVQNIHRIK